MIERNEYPENLISFKDKDLMKVITGIHRCGRSMMFGLYQSYLKKNRVGEEQIITVNSEGGDYHGIYTPEKLYQYVEGGPVKSDKNYVFLNEVQRVGDFQKAVGWFYVKRNVDLYITGFNTLLLSGELTTLLLGGYVEIKMFPLSFKEHVSTCPENINTGTLYMNYLQSNSPPGTLELAKKQNIRVYLEGIYNTTLLKDIVTRKKISGPPMLQSVVEFIFDNTGNVYSSTEIANAMTSSGRKISVPAVENYLPALYDSFILYKVGRYDAKGKQYLAIGAKYYVADIRLRYSILGTKQIDMGHILENIVYLEFMRRGYEVHIEKAGGAEVDFIVIGTEREEYYQISQIVLEKQTLERELSSLDIIEGHNLKYLLTMDYTPLTPHNSIKQVNVLEWFLKK